MKDDLAILIDERNNLKEENQKLKKELSDLKEKFQEYCGALPKEQHNERWFSYFNRWKK